MPAAPELKARIAAAVEDHRAEILELLHPNSKTRTRSPRSRSTRPPASWPKPSPATGFHVEQPGRPARDRVRATRAAARGRTGHGSASSPSTTRCRASATAAATTRWPRPGVGAAIALAGSRAEFAGEIVFFGTPAEERGSGKQS